MEGWQDRHVKRFPPLTWLMTRTLTQPSPSVAVQALPGQSGCATNVFHNVVFSLSLTLGLSKSSTSHSRIFRRNTLPPNDYICYTYCFRLILHSFAATDLDNLLLIGVIYREFELLIRCYFTKHYWWIVLQFCIDWNQTNKKNRSIPRNRVLKQ